MSKLDKHAQFIKDEMELGHSSRDIATALGVGKSTVNDYLAKRGLRVINEKSKKVLVIAIETKPTLAYVWGVWQQNIQPAQILEEKSIISLAAKWVGEKKIEFFSTYHNSYDEMVDRAWLLLDEADAVVHYNGYKFDIPHLNQSFLELGYSPPSGFYQVDLLKTMRTEFNFTHNKLDHIAATLLNERKVEHEGFRLWLKCMGHGTAKEQRDAWKRMKEYNIGDVKLTEDLYNFLLPWLKTPNLPRKRLVDSKYAEVCVA